VHAFLDHALPIAFAHRGGTEAAPENTLAAFRAAYDIGIRYLETDAHLTKDGVVVAFHDATLDRATDRTGAISDLTAAQVAEARVGGTERVPLLAELFEEFPDARLNLDAKSDAVVEPLGDLIERCDAVDRVCVGSFAISRLHAFRRRFGPRLCTVMGPAETARLRVASLTTHFAGTREVPCAQVPIRQRGVTIVDRRFVATAHKLSIAVHVWTVDDAAEMGRLVTMGVDGIMTDRPSVLKHVLVGRGLWR
jgi:glycerophosphoryl diester phosphodiesterase